MRMLQNRRTVLGIIISLLWLVLVLVAPVVALVLLLLWLWKLGEYV